MKPNKTIQLGVLIALFAFAVSTFADTSYAITNGTPDGNNHPYVCLVAMFSDPNHDGTPDSYLWRLSGVLISPRVVVTAAHGTDGADIAKVWFDSSITSTDPWLSVPGGLKGTPVTYPEYEQLFGNGLGLPTFDQNDVGVVVLDEPHPMTQYGLLPSTGLVDTLGPMTPVDLVGYGVQEQTNPRNNGPMASWVGYRTRYYAPAQYVASQDIINGGFLKLTANPGQGKGGTAFGDSGGPIFLAGTRIVLGVNSFVTNLNCGGVTYAQRLDIQAILNWINTFP